MEIVLIILIIGALIYLYFQIKTQRRILKLRALTENMIVQALITKTGMTPNEYNEIRKKVLANMGEENYKEFREDLLKIGIDIEVLKNLPDEAQDKFKGPFKQ
jgi:hypothetical protein